MELPLLSINGLEIKQAAFTKFPVVQIDKNIQWEQQINLAVQNKISKNVGIMFKAKTPLDLKSILNLYYFFVHNHLNYGNTTWASTNMT